MVVEVVLSTHLRSCAIIVPRNMKDFTVGVWGVWAPPEVCYHLYILQGIQLQVVLAAPESQDVNFLSVGGLVAIGD